MAGIFPFPPLEPVLLVVVVAVVLAAVPPAPQLFPSNWIPYKFIKIANNIIDIC